MRTIILIALLLTNCAPRASKESSKLDGRWFSQCLTLDRGMSKKTELTIKLGKLFIFEKIVYENKDCSEQRHSVFTEAYSLQETVQVDRYSMDGLLHAQKKEMLVLSDNAVKMYNESQLYGSDNWIKDQSIDVSQIYVKREPTHVRISLVDDLVSVNELELRRAP